MEKTKPKKVPTAVKKTPEKKPAKPASKLRRFVMRFFLLMLLLGGVAVAGLYNRWFPLSPELDARIEPYRGYLSTAITTTEGLVEKAKPWLEKVGIGKKEEQPATRPAQTNFPLVETEPADRRTETPPQTPATGPTGVAAAAPGQPAGAIKPPLKIDPETQKVYNRLARLYSAMKAEEAVAVFNNLEDEQVIRIMARMDEDAAAKILATMESKRAARLTQAKIKQK